MLSASNACCLPVYGHRQSEGDTKWRNDNIFAFSRISYNFIKDVECKCIFGLDERNLFLCKIYRNRLNGQVVIGFAAGYKEYSYYVKNDSRFF
jgi:hypothetical protein